MARIGTQKVVGTSSLEVFVDSPIVAMVVCNNDSSNERVLTVSVQPREETKSAVSNFHVVWQQKVAADSTSTLQFGDRSIALDASQKLLAVADGTLTFYLVQE
jgi:hypothetical protein